MSRLLEPWLIKIMNERSSEYGERMSDAARRAMSAPRWCGRDIRDEMEKEFQKIASEIRTAHPEKNLNNYDRFCMWAIICMGVALLVIPAMLLIGIIFGARP